MIRNACPVLNASVSDLFEIVVLLSSMIGLFVTIAVFYTAFAHGALLSNRSIGVAPLTPDTPRESNITHRIVQQWSLRTMRKDANQLAIATKLIAYIAFYCASYHHHMAIVSEMAGILNFSDLLSFVLLQICYVVWD
eukprot:4589190-Amphidinium_carterae.1